MATRWKIIGIHWNVFTSWCFIAILQIFPNEFYSSVDWRLLIWYIICSGVLCYAPCFLFRGAHRTVQIDPEKVEATIQVIMAHRRGYDKDVKVHAKLCEGVLGPTSRTLNLHSLHHMIRKLVDMKGHPTFEMIVERLVSKLRPCGTLSLALLSVLMLLLIVMMIMVLMLPLLMFLLLFVVSAVVDVFSHYCSCFLLLMM